MLYYKGNSLLLEPLTGGGKGRLCARFSSHCWSKHALLRESSLSAILAWAGRNCSSSNWGNGNNSAAGAMEIARLITYKFAVPNGNDAPLSQRIEVAPVFPAESVALP